MSEVVELSLVGAVVVALLAVLAYWLVRRDRGIKVTRLGVFVERERYGPPPDGDDDQPTVGDEGDTLIRPPSR
jgi:hypothetical protein